LNLHSKAVHAVLTDKIKLSLIPRLPPPQLCFPDRMVSLKWSEGGLRTSRFTPLSQAKKGDMGDWDETSLQTAVDLSSHTTWCKVFQMQVATAEDMIVKATD